ncbi:MAG: Uncharacterized protein Greene041679_151 [Parcubacteria group bacterium Greene0416_79]|nr:MAG: Uncharacterized protein Greene041679_151 [Parcubacteria group bacterium Greene0416_79]
MYEIEIKSLLGSKERAEELKSRLAEHFPALKALSPHQQLNHYFTTTTDLSVFEKAITPFLSAQKQRELSEIVKNVRGGVSIRTREADGAVFVILKASIGDDSSANGVSRVEFECVIPPVADNAGDCDTTNVAHTNKSHPRTSATLEKLDKILLNAGLSYEAKWSREREEYVAGAIRITIDRNAGYGYLAEFEKMIGDEREADYARRELKALMAELGCAELPQERLERMFAFYNTHWEEYYGTERVFVVE